MSANVSFVREVDVRKSNQSVASLNNHRGRLYVAEINSGGVCSRDKSSKEYRNSLSHVKTKVPSNSYIVLDCLYV